MRKKIAFLNSVLEKFKAWFRKVSQKSWFKVVTNISVTIAFSVVFLRISIGAINIYIGMNSPIDDSTSDTSTTTGLIRPENVKGSRETEIMTDMREMEAAQLENDREEYLADLGVKYDPEFEESATSTEALETEANNSSTNKIYSLNWERDEKRNWKLKYGGYSYVQKGWFLTEGKRYYFIDGMCASGWQEIDGKWYYFDEYTGTMVTDRWRSSADKWFYLGDDGYMIESATLEDSDIPSETIGYKPDQTEDQSEESNGSIFAFSSDFSINYDQEMEELYIIGDISSDHELKDMIYTYCTPYEIFSDTISLDNNEISSFDLFELSYLINDITYSRREDIDGDYIFIITATDCSGNSISGGLLWVFKGGQMFPFELGQTLD